MEPIKPPMMWKWYIESPPWTKPGKRTLSKYYMTEEEALRRDRGAIKEPTTEFTPQYIGLTSDIGKGNKGRDS